MVLHQNTSYMFGGSWTLTLLRRHFQKCTATLAGLSQVSGAVRLRRMTSGLTCTPPDFSVGDFALLRRAGNCGHKLSFVWTGPRRVVNAKSYHVFTVENLVSGKREVKHTRRLQQNRADMDCKPVVQQLLHAAKHNETHYETSNILHKIRADGSDIRISVEWDGLPDDVDHTWEPLSQLSKMFWICFRPFFGVKRSR